MAVPNTLDNFNNKSKMSSDMRSVPDLKNELKPHNTRANGQDKVSKLLLISEPG